MDSGRDSAPYAQEGHGGGGGKRQRGDDWKCNACGNVNFAFRDTCNMRKCGKPRGSGGSQASSGNDGGYQASNGSDGGYSGYPTMGGQGGQPNSLGMGGMGGMQGGGMGYGIGGMGNMQGGMGNMGNMGNMFSMNSLDFTGMGMNSMGMPGNMQPMGMAGMPGMGMGMVGMNNMSSMPMSGYSGGGYSGGGYSGGGPYKPQQQRDDTSRKRRGGPESREAGDWYCMTCGNMNFHFRTTCNMRSCNAPKPTIDGYYPPAEQSEGRGGKGGGGERPRREPREGSGTPPEGSWTCSCGNVNYPFRTKCNRRNCGLDKPSEGSEPQEQEQEQE